RGPWRTPDDHEKRPRTLPKGCHRYGRAGRRVLQQAGLGLDDVAWWIPHQANLRLIEEARRQLGMPEARTVNLVDRIGNSSAATIPLALALEAHRFAPGDLLLLTAVGADCFRPPSCFNGKSSIYDEGNPHDHRRTRRAGPRDARRLG
ncbi:3-oxoacyl-[acyl-carrier-protein] synthase III C-terminal domain-containing protein, partial [Rhodothermus marinus]|uniref:3-oxoacyl-[acyl-carrier-protein] synthase III C-terminal domain-containing protein n=1 Tax=Rhodothermus marinus TaxID=29549 RepID=UPI0023428B3C